MQSMLTVVGCLLLATCCWASANPPPISSPESSSLDNFSSENYPPLETRVKPLTLEGAITQTLANHPQLHQYRLRQQGQAALRSASSLPPALTIGLEVENFAGSDAFRGLDGAETTLALSSVIELGDKARSRVAVVDAKTERLQLQRQVATLDLLGELTAHYIRALATQQSILLAEEALSLSRQMLVTVERRAKQGAAPEAEVMRARAGLSRASITLNGLRSSFERQKVLLATFWNETSPGFEKLSGSLSRFDQADDFTQLYRRAQRSPAIALLASEARLQDAGIKLAQAQGRVDVGWQLGIRHFAESDATALTAGISLPLFSGKRNRGAVAAALAGRNEVDFQRAAATLDLYQRLYAAFSLRQQNIAAYEQITTEVLPALENALQLTRQAYENGRYRYQDWLAAQAELLAAKQQQIEVASAAQLNQALIEQLAAEPLPLAVQ